MPPLRPVQHIKPCSSKRGFLFLGFGSQEARCAVNISQMEYLLVIPGLLFGGGLMYLAWRVVRLGLDEDREQRKREDVARRSARSS